ncbi:hypothetical protein BD560DRAFT_421851 [Blakeslea trispora]|nr:hypothetical protein BD560DRAFT_421851 [Blakeslea trispora]
MKKFRDRNIRAAESDQVLNDVRVLSFSHVFPVVEHKNERSITSHMNEEQAEAMLYYANNSVEQQMPEVSDEAVLFCNKLSKITNDDRRYQPPYPPASLKASKEFDDLVLSICNELNQNRASASNQSEAAFINQSLMPFIKNTPMDEGMKPDFVLGIETRKTVVLSFFVEVKKEKAESKYQVESDFVKLMKQMKTSIDKQLQMGVQSPVSFGLLCEGFDCSFYKMVLAVEGVYLPVMIRELSLVKKQGWLDQCAFCC